MHVPTVSPESLSSEPFRMHRKESRVLATDFTGDPALEGGATLSNPVVKIWRWNSTTEEWADASSDFANPEAEVSGAAVLFRIAADDPDDPPSGSEVYAVGVQVSTSDGDRLYSDHRLVLLGGAS